MPQPMPKPGTSGYNSTRYRCHIGNCFFDTLCMASARPGPKSRSWTDRANSDAAPTPRRVPRDVFIRIGRSEHQRRLPQFVEGDFVIARRQQAVRAKRRNHAHVCFPKLFAAPGINNILAQYDVFVNHGAAAAQPVYKMEITALPLAVAAPWVAVTVIS